MKMIDAFALLFSVSILEAPAIAKNSNGTMAFKQVEWWEIIPFIWPGGVVRRLLHFLKKII